MPADILRLDAAEVDLERRLVRRDDGDEHTLTEQEHGLLAYLWARSGRTVARDELLEHVWGYSTNVVTRAIDVAVRRLRAKIEADPSEPTHIVAVRGVGYRFEGPAPPTSDAPALPHERSSLVGREAELERLRELWDAGSRLVTLTGPPGVGKSRLALRFARSVAEAGDVSVFAVPLADAETPARGLQRVASALGLALQTTHDATAALEQLTGALRARGPLVVLLDDAEHLVEVVARAASACLSEAGDLRVLVTSRERLRVQGEAVVRVPPLQAASAEALLLERARAISAGWGADDLDAVAAIAERLDHTPLALELAAARAAVLPAPALLEALDERFRVLEARGRDARDRQATLERAIDWSWSLLGDWERSALAQLSVFRGGFSSASAGEVLDLSGHADAPWVLDQVQALVERSLVQGRPSDGQIRFRLPESIRLFAEARARDLGELDDAVARHRAHFLELGEHLAARVHGPHGEGALGRLRHEADNLRAALHGALAADPDAAARLALALDDLAASGGSADARLTILDEAIGAGPRPELEARLLIARARPRVLAGDPTGALDDASRAREVAAAIEQPQLERHAQLVLGEVHAQTGDPEGALGPALACAEAAREAGNDSAEARALLLVAAVAFARSDGETLTHALERLEVLVARTEDPLSRARLRHAQARQATAEGQHAMAVARYDEALALSEALGDDRRAALVRADLAFELCTGGELEQALGHFEEALRQHRQAGHLRSAVMMAGNVGQLLLLLGRVGDALEVLDVAVQEARTRGTSQVLGSQIAVRGLARLVAGDAPRALEDLEAAVEVYEQQGRDGAARRSHALGAMAAARLDDRDRARAHLAAAEGGSGVDLVFRDAAASVVAAASGDDVEARERLAAARAAMQAGGRNLGTSTWELVLPREVELVVELAALFPN